MVIPQFDSGPVPALPVNKEHPLRPDDGVEQKIWDIAAGVPDPEIPVISIADLGILRGVSYENHAQVTITPTYSGCPAMEHITTDVRQALIAAGYKDPQVELVLHPAWTTDWMTEHGKAALREYGIAPPQARDHSGPIRLTLSAPPAIRCPHCGSENTTKLTQFGSTSCKALYNCQDCHEPFDYFKVH